MSRQILEHLVEEPESQDTFEGLASWWLLKRDLARRAAALRTATDYLVERGFLKSQRRADGQVHYCLESSRLAEIRKFLSDAIRQPPSQEAT